MGSTVPRYALLELKSWRVFVMRVGVMHPTPDPLTQCPIQKLLHLVPEAIGKRHSTADIPDGSAIALLVPTPIPLLVGALAAGGGGLQI